MAASSWSPISGKLVNDVSFALHKRAAICAGFRQLDLGYGERGVDKNIGFNELVVFQVELLEITK
jgi:hypothetical protein